MVARWNPNHIAAVHYPRWSLMALGSSAVPDLVLPHLAKAGLFVSADLNRAVFVILLIRSQKRLKSLISHININNR